MPPTRTKKDGWVKAGTIGIDTGRLLLADPCYAWQAKEWWDAAMSGAYEGQDRKCQDLIAQEATSVPFPSGHAGCGMVLGTGYGDGMYEVWMRLVKGDPRMGPPGHKRVAEVSIVFIDAAYEAKIDALVKRSRKDKRNGA